MNRIEIRAEDVPLPPWTKKAESYIHKTLEYLDKKNWNLSVLFCSNKYIKSLNAQFRNIDEATDVLAFPLGEKNRNGRFTAGDIAVSLDALEENSRLFKVSADEELRRLLIHGILHLSGEDHKSNRAEEPMLITQEEILTCINAVVIGGVSI